MKDFYGHASIFISASYFENMSMVLLEALASGCRVIASNVGGNLEVVDKSSLFEARDIKQLRIKIIKSMIYSRSKKFNLQNFNWDKIIKFYLRCLR